MHTGAYHISGKGKSRRRRRDLACRPRNWDCLGSNLFRCQDLVSRRPSTAAASLILQVKMSGVHASFGSSKERPSSALRASQAAISLLAKKQVQLVAETSEVKHSAVCCASSRRRPLRSRGGMCSSGIRAVSSASSVEKLTSRRSWTLPKSRPCLLHFNAQ